ncbi:MAG: hypothetical protein IT394_05600 [Candidatus Omnitrophica bacterium]|nr:hypothetical protein [Candidatus Omnitrophota bacterium]
MASDNSGISSCIATSWWQPVLFAGLAGGMGWGIRGQYGHETGAMIAGLLVSLTLVFLMAPPTIKSLSAARAAALATAAIGIGGTMTYGQTIGLTQNANFIGHWEAWRWGMIGLSIKGGIWISFAGAFLGIGLGGVKYRYREMLLLMGGLLVAYMAGIFLLNSPFDPANKKLPGIYFSESWYWNPDGVDLKPRYEYWGGLLFALVALVVYASLIRKDRLSLHMALWGFLGGALGFPLGQCLQSFHAWNPEVFHHGFWVSLDPYMNWWNMMEITFGTIMGSLLGLGIWLNRARIHFPTETEPHNSIPSAWEWGLFVVHCFLLVAAEFIEIPVIMELYDNGLILAIIPIVAVTGGAWWPYFLIFPVTLVPIAGKTLRSLGYEEMSISLQAGWILYVILPVSLAVLAAVYFKKKADLGQSCRQFAGIALLATTWLYFSLNYAFFNFPFPWLPWTGRTPSGLIFTTCAVGLTLLVLFGTRKGHAPSATAAS